jgi:glycosyltransferase involved in cell wall biosynthesis
VTRCALVVTTHRRPDALGRVLASVARQSRLPDEVIVAEDGADPVTAGVVQRFSTGVVERSAAAVSCPVRHLRQPHEGVRAGRIRNVAVATTDCDYVVLLDGDMVVHPDFVADHLALARRGHYSQGTRILLDARATRALLEAGSALPGAASAGLGSARRVYALHAPRLAPHLRRVANSFVAVKACNQGFWRDDLLAVNGFDEAMRGWGAEDKELCARLDNAGVRRQSLLFAAIAFHLGHEPAPRDAADANRAHWLETVRTGRRRCEVGIDGHWPRSTG